MALSKPQAEPSMEEILASIRRIISEEDETKAEPLELTTPAVEPPAPPPPPQPVARAPMPPADDVVAMDDDEPPRPPAPKPAPAKPAVAESLFEDEADSLASAPTISAAAGAFTRLAGSLRISDAPGQTLESIVREMLRPMMKEWLDENLPGLVEAKVEQELERIARMSR